MRLPAAMVRSVSSGDLRCQRGNKAALPTVERFELHEFKELNGLRDLEVQMCCLFVSTGAGCKLGN